MWWIWVLAAATLAVIIAFKRMPIELIYASSATHKKRAFIVKIYGIKVIGDRRKPKKQKIPSLKKMQSRKKAKKIKKERIKTKKTKTAVKRINPKKKMKKSAIKGLWTA